jgi:hypothetical protein
MNQLFEMDWPPSKLKYLLFNEATEKKSRKVYDDYLFRKGEKINIENDLIIEKSWGKRFADYHFGVGIALYVNERFIECLKALGETNYQLIPISVLPEEKPYFILNILNIIDCVDREKSKYRLWTEEDERPDRLGDFHVFDEMILDRNKVPKDVHIFRLKGFDLPVFITNKLADEFEKNKIKGFSLKPVG